MRLANNLIERVGRIIRSNLNSLIESLENSDPKMIIAQATVKIDDALEEIRKKNANILNWTIRLKPL